MTATDWRPPQPDSIWRDILAEVGVAPNLDVALLDKALSWARAEAARAAAGGGRGEWDQSGWWERRVDADGNMCGTAGCLAGWITIAHAGAEPIWSKRNEFVLAGADSSFIRLDGEKTSVPALARELLGITDRQADLLFSGSNNLRRLYWFANRLSGGQIMVPDERLPDETGVRSA